jgi:MFS family permease
MVRRALLGTLVGLVLCIGFAPVALADAAPAAAAPTPPAHPASPPGQAGPSPGYARPPVYPAAIPAVPAAQVADREEGRAPPPAAPHRRKFGLAIAGVVMFVAGYVGSVLSLVASSALASEGAESGVGEQMLIPIAGPWLQLSSTNWDAVGEDQRGTAQFTLVLQGVLQGVGAVLATVGIAQVVATTPPENERPRRPRALSLQLGPTNGGAFGMLRGAF